MSNGLRVVLAERHEIPVVNFWLEVNSGFASDETVLPGTAQLASGLLTGGTKRRTALEISEELQMLGAQLSSGCNLDMATVYLTALKATLDDSLDIFADVILNPDFPEADFERQRQLQLAAISNEKVTPIQMALRRAATDSVWEGACLWFAADGIGHGRNCAADEARRHAALSRHVVQAE